MPEYRIRKTGELITNLQAAFPNVSLPGALSAEDFDVLGIDPVLATPQPEATRYQSVSRDGVEHDAKGNWVERWRVVDLDAEQAAAIDARQWETVRAERNAKLAASDWIVTRSAEAGVPVPSGWRSYRQALRDVTAQPDPFAIVWPTPPE